MSPAFRLLVVGIRNTCRSAAAERLLRASVADHGRQLLSSEPVPDISSAGVGAVDGAPFDPVCAAAAARHGADTSGFRSRAVTPEMLDRADLVLTLDASCTAAVLAIAPDAGERTFAVRELGRLSAEVDPSTLRPDEGEARLHAWVAATAAARARTRSDGAGDDLVGPDEDLAAAHEAAVDGLPEALRPVTRGLLSAVRGTWPDGEQDTGMGSPAQRTRGRFTQDRPDGSTEATPAAQGRPIAWALAQPRVAALVVVLLLLGAATYVAVQGYRARQELLLARAAAQQLRADLLADDVPAARVRLREVQQRSVRAAGATSGPLWALATHAPYVGDDVNAVRVMAGAVRSVALDVLPPVVDAAGALTPAALRPSGETVALAPIQEVSPSLLAAARSSRSIQRRVAGLPSGSLLSPVRRALADIRGQLATLVSESRLAATTSTLVPQLMGADGRRSYLVVFQNNAEARGTGGLIGAYGVLDADHGSISLRTLGANGSLRDDPALRIGLDPDFRRLYGTRTPLWVNGNLSPHFPYAARIWLALWQAQHGERLDGVLATDPVALARLLTATGPTLLPDGEQLTGDNAVRLTMQEVYARFPSDRENRGRDRYLLAVAKAAFQKILSGEGDPRALLSAVAWAGGQQRLLVYSARSNEQAELSGYSIAGEVPTGARPYLAMTLNSAVPSKLDYYLDRRLTYVSTSCTAKHRTARAVLTLTNSAPARGLPAYVARPPGSGTVAVLKSQPRATNYLFLDIVSTAGGGLRAARIDGKRVAVRVGRLRGHPVYGVELTLRPGQTRRISVDLVLPRTDIRMRIAHQPLVRPYVVTRTETSCAR